MHIKLVNFQKDFDAERVVTNHNPMENKVFTEDGIFSEEIFGNYHTSNKLQRAWIDLGDNYIIHPLLFPYLKKVIPKLVRIIKSERSIDTNGEEIIIGYYKSNSSLNRKFEGIFDGNGHTIKNTITKTTAEVYALFPYVNGSNTVIKNLTVEPDSQQSIVSPITPLCDTST